MAEPQKSVVIAEIGAAHGVRGEVRVKAHTADPLAIADYGPLHDGRGNLFRVKSPEESKYPWDYYSLVRTIPAEEAFSPLSESRCPLVKK